MTLLHPSDTPDQSDDAPLSVLVVEDETTVAVTLQSYLDELGHDVIGWATTADDAERLAADHRPDMVLMDICIKGERDGLAAAGRLRERYSPAFVFVTGAVDAHILAQIRALGAVLLAKPFMLDDLANALEQARTAEGPPD